MIFEALLHQSDLEPTESTANPYVTITEFQKLTEHVQKWYNQKIKELKKRKEVSNLDLRRDIITSQEDPYGIVERVWRILDPSEVMICLLFNLST